MRYPLGIRIIRSTSFFQIHLFFHFNSVISAYGLLLSLIPNEEYGHERAMRLLPILMLCMKSKSLDLRISSGELVALLSEKTEGFNEVLNIFCRFFDLE